MKLIIILIIIYPFNSISSQQGCCEFLEKLSERKQWFKTEFNNDSTNHRLVVWDTVSQKIILKYEYRIDRIEKISEFDNMKILFNDETTENIELSFTIQEKK